MSEEKEEFTLPHLDAIRENTIELTLLPEELKTCKFKISKAIIN